MFNHKASALALRGLLLGSEATTKIFCVVRRVCYTGFRGLKSHDRFFCMAARR
jgi:hypothetical protein